jgi:hypothetical protein
LNSRIGFSSFPVRVTVGLESNASELALHVEQTVRACAIDYDDRGMATMFGRTGLSGGRQLALVDVAILPTQERKSSVTVMPRHASGSGKKNACATSIQNVVHHVRANLPAAPTTTHPMRIRKIDTAKSACFLNSLRPSFIRAVRRKNIERTKRIIGIAAAAKAINLKIIVPRSVLLFSRADVCPTWRDNFRPEDSKASIHNGWSQHIHS